MCSLIALSYWLCSAKAYKGCNPEYVNISALIAAVKQNNARKIESKYWMGNGSSGDFATQTISPPYPPFLPFELATAVRMALALMELFRKLKITLW